MKRLLSLSAALALAAGVLSGCWGSDSSSSSMNSSSATDPATGSSSASSGSMSSGLSDAVSGAGDAVSDVVSGAGGAASDVMSGAGSVASDAGNALSDAASGAGSAVSRATGGTSSHASSSAPAAAANAAAGDDGWMLRLVSAASPLPEDFQVRTANIDGYDTRPFDMRAADALNGMLRAAEQDGTPLYLVSAYRSIGRQKALFERKAAAFEAEGLPREEAERQAAQWVARPGTSEHNLGLAADIVSADWYNSHDDLTADFEQTPAFAWLQEHCAEHGFILRYPKGKEAITGITYEPWHYRYVGVEAAQAIMAGGLTLEEYLQQT